jgi:hypothetical protein
LQESTGQEREQIKWPLLSFPLFNRDARHNWEGTGANIMANIILPATRVPRNNLAGTGANIVATVIRAGYTFVKKN